MSDQPYDPVAHPYPKWKYHGTLPPRRVQNREEDKALGEEWGEKAAYREIAGDVESRTTREDQARQRFPLRLEERAFNDPAQCELPACSMAPGFFKEELQSYVDEIIGIWSEGVEPKESQKVLFKGTLFRAHVKPLIQKEYSTLKRDYKDHTDQAGLDKDEQKQHLKQLEEAVDQVLNWAWRQLFPSSCDPGELKQETLGSQAGRKTAKTRALSKGRQRKAKQSKFHSLGGLQAKEMTLRVVSRRVIKARARGMTEDYSYQDMEFADRRHKTSSPNCLWLILLAFARQNNQSWQDLASTSGQPAKRSAVEANIARLRSRLRSFFGLKDNSIQCTKGIYKPIFKIYFEKQFLRLASEGLATTKKSDLEDAYEDDCNPRHLSPEKLDLLERGFLEDD